MDMERLKSDESLSDRELREMIDRRADYLLGPLSDIELVLNTPVKLTGLDGTTYEAFSTEFGGNLSIDTTKKTILSAISPDGVLIASRRLRINKSPHFPIRDTETVQTELCMIDETEEELVIGYVSDTKNEVEELTTYIGRRNYYGLVVDVDLSIGMDEAVEIFQLSASEPISSF